MIIEEHADWSLIYCFDIYLTYQKAERKTVLLIKLDHVQYT